MNRTLGAATIGAVATLVVAVGAAQAATLTTSVISTGWFGTDAPGALVDLPLFDTNLGTLTQVSLSETGQFRGSAILSNSAPQVEAFAFHMFAHVGVDQISSDPGAVAQALSGFGFDPTLPTANYSLGKVGTATDDVTYGVFTANWGSSAITNLSTQTFQAVGGGTAPFHIDAISEFEDTPGKIEINSVFYNSQVLQADANFQVTYSYVPAAANPVAVPEPASWALMILGFGLTGGLLRRRGTFKAA